MKNVHDIFFNRSRTSLFCSYHCVHNLFTQFAYLMRFRSSTTVLITYVVLFCFLLFEPLFNRSNFTFMLLTHPRRSRDPHIHMYVTFNVNMVIPAFQSKATLLILHGRNNGFVSRNLPTVINVQKLNFFSQLTGSDENFLKHLGGVASNSLTHILQLNNTDSIDEFPPQIIPTSSYYDYENFISLIKSTNSSNFCAFSSNIQSIN